MKNFSYLVTAGMLVTGIAQATSVAPNFERAIFGAKLSPTGDTVTSRELKAQYLTLNKRAGSKDATSFTLTEDTGVRCVTIPCPSTKPTKFRVTGIHASFHRGDSVRYEATEVLTNIPPHVRIAPRKLNVTESSMELVAPGGGGFMRRTMWEVEVVSFSKAPMTYGGSPRNLVSVALEDVSNSNN